jgi:hypothetical protein
LPSSRLYTVCASDNWDVSRGSRGSGGSRDAVAGLGTYHLRLKRK